MIWESDNDRGSTIRIVYLRRGENFRARQRKKNAAEKAQPPTILKNAVLEPLHLFLGGAAPIECVSTVTWPGNIVQD